MSAGVLKGLKRRLYSLELELGDRVSQSPDRGFGNHLRSSGKAGNTLTMSPVPFLLSLIIIYKEMSCLRWFFTVLDF